MLTSACACNYIYTVDSVMLRHWEDMSYEPACKHGFHLNAVEVYLAFIHSGYFYIAPLQVHYYSETLPTIALILCRCLHAEALQATASEGLAQGPYVAAGAGFEPATIRSKGTTLQCPTTHHNVCMYVCFYKMGLLRLDW